MNEAKRKFMETWFRERFGDPEVAENRVRWEAAVEAVEFLSNGAGMGFDTGEQVEAWPLLVGGEPFVLLRRGVDCARLTLPEANDYLLRLCLAMRDVECEAAIYRWLRKQFGITDPGVIGGMIEEFRASRQTVRDENTPQDDGGATPQKPK